MAKYVIEETTLTNTANAIREKTGKTEAITPTNFATEIASIESGGGETPTFGFVPTKWKTTGSNQYKGLIIEGKWYGTEITEAAFYTSEGPSYIYGGPFGMLEKITFANEVNTIGIGAFYNCRKLILSELPNGLTSLLRETFYGCASIPEMTCQGDIKYINNNCFSGCSKLSKFILPNITSIPSAGSNIFKNTPIAQGTGYVYVPDDLVDSFKSATNWSTYADQIKPISELEVE